MKYPLVGKWVDHRTHQPLIEELYEAKTYFHRMVGLQFKRTWNCNHGLLIKNCRAIHTMWMRFPLDVYFLDEQFCVVEQHLALRPWRILSARARGARHTIELASGPQRGIELSATRIEIFAFAVEPMRCSK